MASINRYISSAVHVKCSSDYRSAACGEQGVRNVTVGYGQCGNLVQDVAALRVLEELTEEYLDRYGYSDVVVTSVLHQWMGGFPQEEAKAFGVISWGSSVAALAKATKLS